MPTVTRESEHLTDPEKFHPAVLGKAILSISVMATGVTIVRLDGWYGRTMRGQRMTTERRYDNISASSMRRLCRAVSNAVNNHRANIIQLDYMAGAICLNIGF